MHTEGSLSRVAEYPRREEHGRSKVMSFFNLAYFGEAIF
jgi:hypothetical protein